jgi:hypothetical protein
VHKNDFDQSMQKILAFYSKPKDREDADHLGDYLAALYESVKWMNPSDLEEVTKKLVQEVSPVKKPMPGQFIAVYHKLRESRGERFQKRECASCGSTSMVMVSLMSMKSGEVKPFAAPCPTCQPGKESDPPEGWVRTSAECAVRVANEATVKFIRSICSNSLDFSVSPAEVLKQYMTLWRERKLKKTASGGFGASVIAALTPAAVLVEPDTDGELPPW